MTAPEFKPWPKTPRLFKDVVVTEKIDGTNGAVVITEDGDVYAQSRKRTLSLDADNFGFARWVYDNAGTLRDMLGVGYHFGEWWGHGINRGYGCEPGQRYFSLFNVAKWSHLDVASPLDALTVVPVLWTGEFNSVQIKVICDNLKASGSYAKPGFDRPEGVCVFHTAANSIFKIPFDKTEPAPIKVPVSEDKRLFREMFWLAA